MKAILIFLSLFSTAYGQIIVAGGGRSIIGAAAAAPASDTVVAKFNFSLTSTSVSDFTAAAWDPHATNGSASDTRNFQPVSVSTTNTARWLGIGGGNVAAANSNGVNSAATNFPSATGNSYWYNNYPVNAWTGWTTGDENAKFSGLDPNKWYTIEVFSGLAAVAGGCPTYVGRLYLVDSTTQRVTNVSMSYKTNTTVTYTRQNLRPNSSGEILFGLYPNEGGNAGNCGQYGVLNAAIITKQSAYK